MTSVTAQWLPGEPGALVTITGHPAGAVTLTRTDANGTRTVPNVPDAIGGTSTVRDYAAALTGPVTYSTATGGTANLAPYAGPRGAWLGVPGAPGTLTPVTVVTDRPERAAATVVHEILDSAAPVAVLRPLLYRRGVLTLAADSAAQAVALGALFDASVVQLRHACSDAGPLDGYLVAEHVAYPPRREGRYAPAPMAWPVEVTYVTVDAPAAGVGSSWTYGTVKSTFATYGSILSVFGTYRDLTAGLTP